MNWRILFTNKENFKGGLPTSTLIIDSKQGGSQPKLEEPNTLFNNNPFPRHAVDALNSPGNILAREYR